MKINKGKSKKKRRQEEESEGDSDLARMRKKYKKTKDREEGSDGDKTRDVLKEGSNMRRILPRKGTREFYSEAWIHFNVGPTSQAVRCPGTFNEKGYILPNTPCPICRLFLKEQMKVNKKYKRGTDAGKEAYFKVKDAYYPKLRYFMNVLRDDGEVRVLNCGEQIMGQLLEHWFEDGSKVGDFTDVTDGRWMNIKKVVPKGNIKKTNYKVIPDDETSELDDWKKVRKQLNDLNEAAGELMKPKDIKALLEGDFDDEDEDSDSEDEDTSSDDESEDDEDEDEDEEKSSSRSRKRRSKKSRDADDDSSDDDDDDDDDEDDDDDDEGEDEDEDEEDDEDEDEEDEDADSEDDEDDEDEEPVKRKKKKHKKHRR